MESYSANREPWDDNNVCGHIQPYGQNAYGFGEVYSVQCEQRGTLNTPSRRFGGENHRPLQPPHAHVAGAAATQQRHEAEVDPVLLGRTGDQFHQLAPRDYYYCTPESADVIPPSSPNDGSNGVRYNEGQHGLVYTPGYGESVAVGRGQVNPAISITTPHGWVDAASYTSGVASADGSHTHVTTRALLPAGYEGGNNLGYQRPPVSETSATSTSSVCLLCKTPRTFGRKSDLARHQKHTHEGEARVFVCGVGDCTQSFHWAKDRVRHSKTHSTGDPKWTCKVDLCSKALSRKDNFRRHMKKKHNTPFSLCPRPDCVEHVLESGQEGRLAGEHDCGWHSL